LSVKIKGQKYYRTSEICELAGVSRSTLWRWIKAGIIEDSAKRDRRGWKLFTVADLRRIDEEAHRIEVKLKSRDLDPAL
jgi:excisionase family DNA binding protein